MIDCNLYDGYSHQKLGSRPGGFLKNRMRGDDQNYGIIEIGLNTENCPGNLRRLAVTQSLRWCKMKKEKAQKERKRERKKNEKRRILRYRPIDYSLSN